MNRDELKAIVQREPTLRGTLAALDEELDPLDEHVNALRKRRDEIVDELETIDKAKRQLEAGPSETPADPPAEPTS